MKSYIGDRNEYIHDYEYAVLPSGRRVLAVARSSVKNGDGLLIYYSDNGLDWTVNFFSTGTATTNASNGKSITINPTTGEILSLVTTTSGSTFNVRKTSDFGVTWTVQSMTVNVSNISTSGFTHLKYDQYRNRLLAYSIVGFTNAAAMNAVVQSKDNGATWTPLISLTPYTTTQRYVTFMRVYEAATALYKFIIVVGANVADGYTFYGLKDTTDDVSTNGRQAYTYTFPFQETTSATYHPINKQYYFSSFGNSSYAPQLFRIEETFTGYLAQTLPAQQPTESVCSITWYPPSGYLVLGTRDNTANAAAGSQVYQRIAKSKSGDASSWAFDPAPTFNISNADARTLNYDSALGLMQSYVAGDVYLGNTIGYFGRQESMPTPTPSPTQTMSATPFASNNVLLGGFQTAVNGVDSKSYTMVSNDGTETLSANLNIQPATAALFSYLHIAGTNEILIWGSYTSIAGVVPQACINRIDIGGTLNPNFVTSGFVAAGATNMVVNSVVQVGPDAFVAAVVNISRLVKFNSNGVADPNWGNALTGLANPNVFLDTYDPTKLYVSTQSKLMRINIADASVDSTFQQNTVDNYITQMIPLADGKVLVYGAFTRMQGDTKFKYIVRLNRNGTIDTTYNVNLNGGPSTSANTQPIALLKDESIVIGGTYTSIDTDNTRIRVAKLDSSGRIDNTFRTDKSIVFSGTVVGIRPSADGRLYVTGYFANLGGQPRNYVARLLSDGSIDTTFNPTLTVAGLLMMYFADDYDYPKVTVTPTVTPSITPTMTPMPSPVFQGFYFNQAPVNGETI
jgi:uncharacterized delta-60 repeat protein